MVGSRLLIPGAQARHPAGDAGPGPGNHLQDLTRDRAADGRNWNDRIDQVAVC